MKLKSILATLALAAAATASAAQPKVIAHRGYWDTPGSAQNSIRALVKADSIGAYASEFDVWMTADSVLVVNHDPSYNGVVIETSPASVVTAQKLANGENLPTLEQYLTAAKPLKTRLVLELKSHNSLSNERAAIKRILEMVKKFGLEDRIDYITFSPTGFQQLVKMAPKPAEVYYLSGNLVPEQIKFMKAKGIDYSLKAMKKHPWWIPECHNLGLEVNVWTVNKPEDMKWCIDNKVDYITTNDPEGLQAMLAGKCKKCTDAEKCKDAKNDGKKADKKSKKK